MTKKTNIALDFEIDCLTNSIRNVISGDSFATEISRLTTADLPQVSQKNRWLFDWKSELADNSREIYKLTIVNNPSFGGASTLRRAKSKRPRLLNNKLL